MSGEQSYDEQKKAEWQRLSNIGWINMSVDDLKATLEALRELLVRDTQWQKKWTAALDLLDGPTAVNQKLRELLRRARYEGELPDELMDEVDAALGVPA